MKQPNQTEVDRIKKSRAEMVCVTCGSHDITAVVTEESRICWCRSCHDMSSQTHMSNWHGGKTDE